MKKLVLASHNKGKLKEFAELLGPLGIEVVSAADLGISEPEETGLTFTANAQLKARHSAMISGEYALSDDSGLVIDALGGAPGIYSARWAGPNKDFREAFSRIRRELKNKNAPLDSPAYFACVLCLCAPDGTCREFEGRVEGRLRFPPKGTKGFGYDPIFIPDGHEKTFAEINPEIKNKMSHRARAFEKFLRYIPTLKKA